MLHIVLWTFLVVLIVFAAFLITRNANKTVQCGIFNGAAMAVYRTVRRSVVFLAGSTVLVIGIIMIVTPGPAFVFIPLGLVILGTEFLWAQRLLVHVKNYITEMAKKASVNNSKPSSGDSPPPPMG